MWAALEESGDLEAFPAWSKARSGWRGGPVQVPCSPSPAHGLSSQGWRRFFPAVGTSTSAFFPCNFTGLLRTNLQLLISCHGLLRFLSVDVFKWFCEVMFLAHSSCWFWLRCCWEGLAEVGESLTQVCCLANCCSPKWPSLWMLPRGSLHQEWNNYSQLDVTTGWGLDWLKFRIDSLAIGFAGRHLRFEWLCGFFFAQEHL